MTDKQLERYDDIPDRSKAPVLMENPNDQIKIYSGDFTLQGVDKVYSVSGEIYFTWFPDMGVKFKCSFINKPNVNFDLTGEYTLLIEKKEFGKVSLTDFNLSNKSTCSGGSRRFIWGDSTIAVREVSFAIPNMREFFGEPVKELTGTRMQMDRSRLTLKDKSFLVHLDRFFDFKLRHEKLGEHGGYLITYAGRIIKQKGSISLSELHNWQDRFHHFLYFLNGRRVAPMFYTGVFEDTKVWTDYSGYTTDTYKYVPCWSEIMVIKDLPQLWKSYNKIWQDKHDKDFLITAIHWYVEANSNAGMIEGSIILIQTALELLYNWLIVEKQKIVIGNDADGMSAANKIRLLIFQFKISPKIPEAFTELGSLPNVIDGPEVFVKIRNALVHGQESKRIELLKISSKAKFEAQQLGIWYVELALLHIMGYNGKYKNRTSGKIWRDTGVPVPWTDDQTFKVGKPSDFSEEEIGSFVELLEQQNKVLDPTETKVKRCKLIAIGFSWGRPVAIGAIKPKTPSDFTATKSNLPERAADFDWEIGYFYTDPDFEKKKFSSTIFDRLLKEYGKGRLMATTEIRDGNRMVNILERRRFKQVGAGWKSKLSDNELRLFLRELPEKVDLKELFKDLRTEDGAKK